MKTLTLTFALLFSSTFGSGQNLISNWSFETGTMQLVCTDWYNRCGNELIISCDSTIFCQVGFAWDSPSLIPEEVWSLDLKPGWPNERSAETYVTGQSGTKVYELKYWMKTPLSGSGNYIIGYGSIGMGSQSQYTPVISASDTAVYWKQITIVDTLNTVATDTITVRLSADNCDLCTGSVYFDFIELNVIANITSIIDPDLNNNENIKIYPNPVVHEINITGEKPVISYNLFTSQSQLITQKDISPAANLKIDVAVLKEGIYFLELNFEDGATGYARFVKK
ncbi:MAG: T9SS type A sorting domain-containing protein [Bacteroidia bacterium]